MGADNLHPMLCGAGCGSDYHRSYHSGRRLCVAPNATLVPGLVHFWQHWIVWGIALFVRDPTDNTCEEDGFGQLDHLQTDLACGHSKRTLSIYHGVLRNAERDWNLRGDWIVH